MTQNRTTYPVLTTPIDVISMTQAVERIGKWASQRESRYVCVCNVHAVVTAAQDAAFHAVLAGADMATPDGAPIAWMLRKFGAENQQRIAGPELMLEYCARAARLGESIYLFGSTETMLAALQAELARRWPNLRVAGAEAPPFRAQTPDEDEATVTRINNSGAATVWVSLGCPKQERWMSNHRGRVQAVCIGVGAAFGFHAHAVPRAPAWMRNHSLEWLHRLASEPKRLWARYFFTNSVFMAQAARQLLQRRR